MSWNDRWTTALISGILGKNDSVNAREGYTVDRAVELMDMLDARDRRARRQQELLEQYRLPLVSFTMNIAGPVKNSPLIRRGFRLGRTLLMGQLERMNAPCVFQEEWDEATGCQGFYVTDLPPKALKELTCALEDGTDLGRLFDLDVLTPDGVKLDRPVPRSCLICGGPARECARSRAHSVPELQARTRELLQTALNRRDAETAASLAVRALLYEVCVTPKPGLVDRANNGSHRDMDIYSFLRSAAALWPYFSRCVQTGRDTAANPAPDTLAALRWPGKLAESAMLAATGGVNTHKGAIFSLGLVCGALGRLDRGDWSRPERILSEVSAMAAGTVDRELSGLAAGRARTAGQRFYLAYGVTGVRGQAEAGFPTVLDWGLPALENGLAQGKSADEAGAAALLALLARTADTNMIARGGIDAQRETAAELERLLREAPYPGRETLERLDRSFTERDLSPGGSADLLALCWLLHFLKEEAD
ncbi:MAG: triphosphoribosyl-dephospho-CoA synthase CitG [Oscillibacter sp.]|nr:triphosphoribosyl-dephospho-CoA synthase CitG [Oscillibacter sp.]